ncbi:MAG: RNA methyltransferase [Acidimicrobiia bacterium]|nr:RNA methyltransferase [Acidimicrobiia bacterium]
MAGFVEINDPADERLDDYRALRTSGRPTETDSGAFLCEGIRGVERLLDSDMVIRSVLVTSTKLDRLGSRLADRDVTVLVASQEVLNATVGFNIHRGVIASALRRPSMAVHDLLSGFGTVAALEGINDHENLGAIFRSALALGIDGVILDSACGDPYYRRVVRVSMGAAFTLPFARIVAPADLVDVLDGAAFASIALTPDPTALPIDRLVLAEGERPALLLGAEGDGLRRETLERATYRVRIPIREGVDSLNVGHAAAVAFHRFGSV